MIGLDTAFYSSIGALQASALGLATANQNIANVHTPGYSREEVNVSPGLAIPSGVGLIGTGVQVDSVTAFRDRFLEARLNQETSSSGKFSTLTDGLLQVETVFNESTAGGIGQAINDLFNAFSDVANDPGLPSARTVLLQRGQVLANNFKSASNRLASLQLQLNRSVGSIVSQVNSIAQHIADLNQRILTNESAGQSANTLRDAREQSLLELSKLVNVSSYEDSTGALAVNAGAGHALVSGGKARSLSTLTGANGLTQVSFNGADITSEIDNGSLAGVIYTRDTAIPQAQTALDDLAAEIISQVNTVHQAGTGLDGSTNNDFFTPFTPVGGSNAGASRTMSVDAGVANSIDKIAASLSGAAGDNANAIALADLQNQAFAVSGGSGTFAELYGRLVSNVGSLSQSAQNDSKVQNAALAQAQSLRDGVSGVSLDEEAVKIIQYQRAYQASAKVVQIVSDLLEETINLVK